MMRLAMLLALVVLHAGAHLASAQLAEAGPRLAISPTLAAWFAVVIPVAVMAALGVIGWLLLGARRPDPVISSAYLVSGLVVLFWIPGGMVFGWPVLGALPLLDGLAGGLWASAGSLVIGAAGLVRFVHGAVASSGSSAGVADLPAIH